MLEEVRIRSLGVITDATLELGPGLTVITGETGAGKTMVVTGLGLLLGARADTAAVRTGAAAALVEGRFSVPEQGPVALRARDAGAALDDEVLLVTRSVAATGRGRAHLGGRAVPVAVLAEIADDLVAVHGQSEQVLLRSPARQREALDRYAGEAVAVPMAAYATTWRRWQEAGRLAGELGRAAAQRRAEAQRLAAALAEVERVAPLPGEDRALAEESVRLEHAEELHSASALAHTALAGDDAGASGGGADAVSALDAARRALEHSREHDERLGELADRVGEVAYLVADIAGDLAGYTAGADVDPLRLDAVQERRAELTALVRATAGCADVDEVLAWARAAAPRLLELEGDDDRVAALSAEHDELGAALVGLAGELTAARIEAAQRLGAVASTELPGLSMPHAQLSVAVTTADDLGPHGADEVVLMLRTAGTEARPLARGASGGELSRVMLALELVLGAGGEVPTFVFDEVDAGVGGRAAVGIGRRLARLARTRQVIVVTHLPQVAAFADRHVRVAKAVLPAGTVDGEDGGQGAGAGGDGLVTVSGVSVLGEGERVAELARMLAGQEDSAAARAHAVELLALRAALDEPADSAAAGAGAATSGGDVGVDGERAGGAGGRRRVAAR